MKADSSNTSFVTIGAWPDWQSKMDVFLRSAGKQRIGVEVLERGEAWFGYYHHKIIRLRDTLLDWRRGRPHLRYVIFTDSRDVVFIKSREAILSLLDDADDEKVLFSLDNKLRTWPMERIWLAHRIALKFGIDGIVNSGCYAGRTDRVVEMLTECIRIHDTLVSGAVESNTIESLLLAEVEKRHLSSDQFHLHAMQALWSDLVDVDVRRRVFACFRDEYPPVKTAPHLCDNGTMPLGTAGILHSPWMLHRDDHRPETESAWKEWALSEDIIDS